MQSMFSRMFSRKKNHQNLKIQHEKTELRAF